MLLDRVLCRDCFLGCLDDDEIRAVCDGKMHIEISNYETECERCGEFTYYVIGLDSSSSWDND